MKHKELKVIETVKVMRNFVNGNIQKEVLFKVGETKRDTRKLNKMSPNQTNRILTQLGYEVYYNSDNVMRLRKKAKNA